MKFTNIKNPRWVNLGHTAIALTVDIESKNLIQVKFVATPIDVEPHGVDLFKRAIEGEFGEIADIVSSASAPDAAGFMRTIKNTLGIIEANAIARSYPLFFPAIEAKDWVDVQTLLIDAYIKGVLTLEQYLTIRDAALVFSIPITLPDKTT